MITREDYEDDILARVRDAGEGGLLTTSFWIAANQKRAGAVDRLAESGRIELDNSQGFPTVIIREMVR